jgi:hypothetical protein
MNMPIVKRVEIAFWDFIIQTLSENQRVREIVRQSYRITHHPSLRRVTGLLAVTALSGLISGAILGVLTTVLR